MNRSLDLKAKIQSSAAVRAMIASITNCEPVVSRQKDIFFASHRGRLKLRVTPSEPARLMFYDRPRDVGWSASRYLSIDIDRPDILATVLSDALGEVGSVTKIRELSVFGNVRVHLDEVQDLGSFLELEIALGDEDELASTRLAAMGILARFGIGEGDLVAGAYVDLLQQQPGGQVCPFQETGHK